MNYIHTNQCYFFNGATCKSICHKTAPIYASQKLNIKFHEILCNRIWVRVTKKFVSHEHRQAFSENSRIGIKTCKTIKHQKWKFFCISITFLWIQKKVKIINVYLQKYEDISSFKYTRNNKIISLRNTGKLYYCEKLHHYIRIRKLHHCIIIRKLYHYTITCHWLLRGHLTIEC